MVRNLQLIAHKLAAQLTYPPPVLALNFLRKNLEAEQRRELKTL